MFEKKFYKLKDNGIILNIKAVPNSSVNEFCGLLEDSLKIKIKAPATENKANLELIKFISKSLKVPKSSVEVVSGNTSKIKNIFIAGLTIDELEIFCDRIGLSL